MPTSRQPGGTDFAKLIGQLNDVIRLAEAGEWERIVELQPALSDALSEVQRLAEGHFRFSAKIPVDRSTGQQLIALIDQAQTLLAARRDTIAPLVGALKSLPVSPDA